MIGYYLEINLISIAASVILLVQERTLSSSRESSRIIFRCLLGLEIALSVSDFLANLFNGQQYINSPAGLEFFNILYYILLALLAFGWEFFFYVRLGYTKHMKKSFILQIIPLLLLSLAICLNPLHHFFFSIDETTTYHREAGVVVSWIVEWSYLVFAAFLVLKRMVHASNKFRRKAYGRYLYFALPVAFCGIYQMVDYGTSVTQIGFMFTSFLIYILIQNTQILQDELTGISNKHALIRFEEELFSRLKGSVCTLFMIDVDLFKTINDTYGHLKGDEALREVAGILKESVSEVAPGKFRAFRYAGDEFVICGLSATLEEIQQLPERIIEKLNQRNEKQQDSYALSVSIGVSTAEVSDSASFEELFNHADDAMYRVKKLKGNNKR